MNINSIINEMNSPKVKVEKTEHTICFKGVCTPEDPKTFFDQIEKLINQVIDEKNKIWFDMDLEYFNTSSFKYFLDVFQKISKSDVDTKVLWRVEADDEELIESGEIIREITKIPLEIIEK